MLESSRTSSSLHPNVSHYMFGPSSAGTLSFFSLNESPGCIMAHCAHWLLEHDNLGGERAAPHQPSPGQNKWRRLFWRLAAPMSLAVCDTRRRSRSRTLFVQPPKWFLIFTASLIIALPFFSFSFFNTPKINSTIGPEIKKYTKWSRYGQLTCILGIFSVKWLWCKKKKD